MAGRGHVALIRGINVGGRNPVPMAELRRVLEAEGFDHVATYIQSGNVIFDASEPTAELEERLGTVLAEHFDVPPVVVVRTHAQIRRIVEARPSGFGDDPDTFHSDVIFLRDPLTPAEALAAVQPREEVDSVWPGRGVLYFQRLSARRTQSRMNRLVGTPAYKHMTIRNWKTTTKLLALLGSR